MHGCNYKLAIWTTIACYSYIHAPKGHVTDLLSKSGTLMLLVVARRWTAKVLYNIESFIVGLYYDEAILQRKSHSTILMYP